MTYYEAAVRWLQDVAESRRNTGVVKSGALANYASLLLQHLSPVKTTALPCPVHGDQACLRWYLKGAHAHPSVSDALEWADKALEDSEELACAQGDLWLPRLSRAREVLNRASVDTSETRDSTAPNK